MRVKGESTRARPPSRADPADRGGGAAGGPGANGARRVAGVPAGMFTVTQGPPGDSQTLSLDGPDRPGGHRRSRSSASRESCGGRPRAEHHEAFRRGMDPPRAAVSQQRSPEQAVARPSFDARRHPLGAAQRCLLARFGPWRTAPLPLREMPAGRPLAAHSRGAQPTSQRRRRLDERCRSGTVVLGRTSQQP